jgi:hypothetical protein
MAHFLMAFPASYAQITAKHVQNQNLLAQLAKTINSLSAVSVFVKDVLTRQNSVFLVYQMNFLITYLMIANLVLKIVLLVLIKVDSVAYARIHSQI